ncbi:MAG: SDR family oxidoreductase [Pseudomonadaceae bacterium]|nr:SDR family oxidoreductase [Pseudomonadaceae bacterium]
MSVYNPIQDGYLVVTGAASGIGLAVSEAAAKTGACVLALDIADRESAGVQRLLSAPNVDFLQCDVSDIEAWNEVVSALVKKPTHLFLNAGIQIAPPDAPLSEYQFDALRLDRYRKMMGVNVDGVVFGLHTLLPKLRDGGSVVVTSSLAGITPYSVDPLYAMSKHAVAGLVRSLGPTLKSRNITLNALCPGGIDTGIIPFEQKSNSPTGEFMTPEHIAEEVLALFDAEETGKTWAKVAQNKPVFIVRAPGDKKS